MSPRALADTALAVTVPASLPLLARLSVGELFSILAAFSAVLVICWRSVLWIRSQAVEATAVTHSQLLAEIKRVSERLDTIDERSEDVLQRVARIEGELRASHRGRDS